MKHVYERCDSCSHRGIILAYFRYLKAEPGCGSQGEVVCRIYPTAVVGLMAAGACTVVPTTEAAAAGKRTLSAFTFASRFGKADEPTESPTFSTSEVKNFESTNDNDDEGDEGDEGNEGDEGEGTAATSQTCTPTFSLFLGVLGADAVYVHPGCASSIRRRL